ncbi:MAG: response regulator, partial [Bacteroidota bacterium]
LHELDFGFVKAIIGKAEEQLLVACARHGLIELQGLGWKIFNEQLPIGDAILCVEKTLDRQVLVGTNEGLYVLKDDGELLEHFHRPAQNNLVSAIAVNGDDWWFAFDRELILASPTPGGIRIKSQIEIDSRINDLSIDQLDNVWVATNNSGLKKFSCLRKIFRPIELSLTAPCFAIEEGGQRNELLVSGDGYCAQLLLSQEPTRPYRSRLLARFDSIVWNACADPNHNDHFWFATQNGLFRSIYQGNPELFSGSGNTIGSPNRILLKKGNVLWLGTISGLYKIADDEVTEVLRRGGNKFGYVYTLSPDNRQQIWVGTLGQGVWLETEDGFEQVDHAMLRSNSNIYCIAPNEYGDTLIIQEEKALLLDRRGEMRVVHEEYPMAAWSCAWIDQHTIALGGNQGLTIVNIQQPKDCFRFDALLPRSEWQFTSTHSLRVIDKNNILCGTNAGLFVFDYEQSHSYRTPPMPRLDEVQWRNTKPEQIDGVYQLKSGKWSLRVSVYAAWFIDEQQVRYRFKMVGFDQNWSSFEKSPFVRYNSLPPGTYELQVQATSRLSGTGPTRSLLKLEVSIPFWSANVQPVINSVTNTYQRLFRADLQNRDLLQRNAELEAEIEERKRLEKELNVYKIQLEQLVENRNRALEAEKDRAKSADEISSQFMANTTREIRTPISGIIGLNDIIADTALSEEQADYISKISQSAHQLLNILNDILDIARLEAGKLSLMEEDFYLPDLLEGVATENHQALRESSIRLKTVLALDTLPWLRGDIQRIQQILKNLIRYIGRSGGNRLITLLAEQLHQTKTHAGFRIELQHTGARMDADELRSFIAAYQQLNSGDAEKLKEANLELVLSHQLLKIMNSELKVNSSPTEGSAYYFTLQLPKSNKLPLPSDSETSAASIRKRQVKTPDTSLLTSDLSQHRGQRILIAEDDKIFQLILEKILTNEGLLVTITSNGEECIRVLEQDAEFDLILMDIRMPEMDGLQTTRYIRRIMNNHKIRIVALTAHPRTDMTKLMQQYGIDDMMTKPIDRHDLLKMFNKWIPVKT